jgi:hypothetical protein
MHQAVVGSFLAKKATKDVSALDSPAIQQRLEALTGKKVDAEKLKKSFANDKFAAVKTVFGSTQVWKDKDEAQVEGLEMVQQKAKSPYDMSDSDVSAAVAAVDTPPVKEAQMEWNALQKIAADYWANKATIDQQNQEQMAQAVAQQQRIAQMWGWLLQHKLAAILDDPFNPDNYIAPVEAQGDQDVNDLLEQKGHEMDPPDELTELSDIQDWLDGKI